ncbi:MAG TPA: caspase family protein [Polyangiaceae bacterium]|nr:caspase family protein [Polyangiaceae bacterium]
MIWLRSLLALAVAIFLYSPTAPADTKGKGLRRFALVIGNNHPEAAGTEPLRYADDDAVAAHLLLSEAGVDSSVFVTPDEGTRALHPSLQPAGRAGWAEVERGFSSLMVRMRRAREGGFETEPLVFYSGHGDVANGEGYVVLEGGRLTRSRLFAMLAQSPASHNHVLVDACKSYYLVFDRGPGGRRSPYASSLAESLPSELRNTGFILSTSSARDSHEWERYQGGILSHQLRSGLRGAADANLDGIITYAELGAFLQTANAAIKNPRFKPDFMVRAPNHELDRPILSFPASRGALLFTPRAWGHFYVENARGERLLDAHPTPEQPLRVQVPAERPLFVRQNDERTEYVVSRQGSVAIAELSESRPEVAQRGALSLAFEWIFSTPFGQADVGAFKRDAQLARDESPPRGPSSSLRPTLLWTSGLTALAAASAGLTLNGVALGTSLNARDTSQKNMAEKNQLIRKLNRASLPCYGVAVAAGLTWAFAKWWPESRVKFDGGSAELEREGALLLRAGREF